MTSRNLRLRRSFWFAIALLLMGCGIAQAQELEGTWRLVMRKLPDGHYASASSSSRGLHGLQRATEPERVLAHTGRQACLRLSDIHLQTVRYRVYRDAVGHCNGRR
jgi:hypothetical protein